VRALDRRLVPLIYLVVSQSLPRVADLGVVADLAARWNKEDGPCASTTRVRNHPRTAAGPRRAAAVVRSNRSVKADGPSARHDR
jgi:hypothetical protein